MRKTIMTVCIAASLLTTSCSRIITVNFAHETPDVSPSDQSFYGRVKTFAIKTSNQSVVYSEQELAQQSMNVIINSIETGLVSQGFTSTRTNPDIEIEVIAVKDRTYITNIATLKNGKQKLYPCEFKFESPSVFVRVNKGDKSVNYTFYSTPCEEGCSFRIGRNCEQSSLTKINLKDRLVPITINAKDNPINAEVIGNAVAVYLTERIRDAK